MANSTKNRAGLILIADDEVTQRVLTRQVLEQAGFAVVEARDGIEALAVYERERPDLVLLDVKMPKIDGFDVCAQIRQKAEDADVPIVMVTGLEDLPSIEHSYQVGATDFITKPVIWPILSHRVRYLLRAGHAISKLRESELRLVQAQRVARFGNWEWDIAKNHLRMSDEIYRLFFIDKKAFDCNFQSFLKLVHPKDRQRVKLTVDNALNKGGSYILEYRVIGCDGNEFIIEQQARVITGADNIALRIIGTIQDISERKDAQNQIHQLAYYDSLTGLPNRDLFRQQAEWALSNAKRDGHKLALIFLDLDQFKYINDTLGHDAGDQLLKTIASYLTHSTRASDFVSKFGVENEYEASLSRLGGDEFTLLLPNLLDVELASRIATRVLELFRKPIKLKGKELFVTASMGIAVYPDDGTSIEELLKNADIAMYNVKKGGRNNFRFYTRHMNERLTKRLSMEEKLKRAIDNEELALHYQPKIEIETGKLIGLEALLRWNNPETGCISPGEFIPVAEDTGLIMPIGKWVLRKACSQAARWHRAGLTPFGISINLSAHQFRQGGLISMVERVLGETSLDPRFLELELTEGVIMDEVAESINVLNKLKAMGIKLSVDDFGVGYSSMAYLKRFPLDILKIDRSFVKDITTDPNDATIIKAIIALAGGLNLTSIAEGVETEEQLAFLRSHGCDQIQGFLISRPKPADQIEPLLVAEQTEKLQKVLLDDPAHESNTITARGS